MMKWAVQELNKFKEQGVDFDVILDVKSSLMQRDSDILDVSPVQVTGHIAVNSSEYILYARVNCSITVPSTRSLKPVEVPLSFEVDEVYMTDNQFQGITPSNQDDFIMVLEKDYIDLAPVIEDYILLNIPVQVLAEEELSGESMPIGDNWEVISEVEYNKRKREIANKQVNPELAKLQELLNNNED